MKKVGEKDRRKNQGQLRSEQEEICGQNNSQGQNLGGRGRWGLTLDRNKQCTKIRQTNFCHGHSSSEPIQSPLTAHITLSTTRHCWKTRNGRRGKPEESQGHLLVFGRCSPGLAAFSPQKTHCFSCWDGFQKRQRNIWTSKPPGSILHRETKGWAHNRWSICFNFSLWQKCFLSKIKFEKWEIFLPRKKKNKTKNKHVCKLIPTSYSISEGSRPIIQRRNWFRMRWEYFLYRGLEGGGVLKIFFIFFWANWEIYRSI